MTGRDTIQATSGVVMARRSEVLLLWAARALGVLGCLFPSLFALDAFRPGNDQHQGTPRAGTRMVGGTASH